jgi:hypothetical protein
MSPLRVGASLMQCVRFRLQEWLRPLGPVAILQGLCKIDFLCMHFFDQDNKKTRKA